MKRDIDKLLNTTDHSNTTNANIESQEPAQNSELDSIKSFHDWAKFQYEDLLNMVQ